MSFQYGDTVILYENTSSQKLLTLKEDGHYQSQFGFFKHSAFLVLPGSKVYSNTGKFLYILECTPALLTLSLPHKTQIIYQQDIAMILLKLDIKPESLVIETGTGSCSLSQSFLANTPKGHLYTYEFNEDRYLHAISFFQRIKYQNVTVCHRDTCGEGFKQDKLDQKVDAVFLDVPRPWEAARHAVQVLKRGGRLCCFSPCIEQVQRNCETLRELGFERIETVESLVREYQRTEMPEKIDFTQLEQDEKEDEKKEEQQQKDVNEGEEVVTGEEEGKVGDKRKRHNGHKQQNQRLTKRAYYTSGAAQQKGHTAYLTFALYP